MRHHQTIGNNIPNNIQADTLVSVRLIVVSDGGAEDADVLEGAVELVGGRLLDAVDDIKAFRDFAKDSILSVQMGNAANSFVDFLHFWRQLYMGSGVETLLNLHQTGVVVYPTPYDIELAGGTAPFRIDSVALASHSHHSTTVEDLRQTEFGLNGVVVVTRTQSLSGLGMFAVQVASLYHEVLDDAMEEQGVVDVLLNEFQEVVTVLGRLVEECYTNVARGSL